MLVSLFDSFAVRRASLCSWGHHGRVSVKAYDEQYYNGKGVDPLVDYMSELRGSSLCRRQLELSTGALIHQFCKLREVVAS
jgi:hypothetical protein